ncbi:MAG: hypothetical protein M1387_00110 [Thaumarchaeota archaeon]|nr:hypothetical protein [Nitrososphaerota archaeon]
MGGLVEKLSQNLSFNEIFELVKKTVEKSLRKHRAGLTLVLNELPNAIGAYHEVGSNLIVMNRTILDAVASLGKSKEELNGFIFSILTHEYLHSLGYLDEGEVRRLVYRVSEENLGRDHVATRMAGLGIVEIYPELKYLGEGAVGKTPEIIKNFDQSSMPYIG